MKPVYWVLIRDPAYVLFIIVEGTCYRHTVTVEQFDSAAQKNLNQNLFIILLLKIITIIHWLMHAVIMKCESLHKNNYFRSFNFLVGAKSTFYSSNECYVHC